MNYETTGLPHTPGSYQNGERSFKKVNGDVVTYIYEPALGIARFLTTQDAESYNRFYNSLYLGDSIVPVADTLAELEIYSSTEPNFHLYLAEYVHSTLQTLALSTQKHILIPMYETHGTELSASFSYIYQNANPDTLNTCITMGIRTNFPKYSDYPEVHYIRTDGYEKSYRGWVYLFNSKLMGSESEMIFDEFENLRLLTQSS